MAANYFKTRVAVSLRANADSDAAVVTSVAADTNLRIISQKGAWYFVSTTHGGNRLISFLRDQRGYVPASALVLDPDADQPEPEAQSLQELLQDLPGQLKAMDLKNWLSENDGQAPPWLSELEWGSLTGGQKVAFKAGRKATMDQNAEAWATWLAEVEANGRTSEALIWEWATILQGGRNMFPIRAHTIRPRPRQDAEPPVWVNPDEVLQWSGRVRSDEMAPGANDWCEVSLFKWDRENRGWFRRDLLEEYLAPTPENDPAIPTNATGVFDLSTPVLRTPQDNAIGSHPGAAQYIDIFPVIERHLTHVNLCGEFCAAALGRMDVFPFLQAWQAAYPRANDILHGNRATFLIDVEAMIDVIGLPHRRLAFSASRPLTARRLQRQLRTGEKLIAGVGIKHTGEIHADGTIAHWVVVVDAMPVGTSGWVRIYNPFHNHEEVYPFAVFTEAQKHLRAGSWVRAAN